MINSSHTLEHDEPIDPHLAAADTCGWLIEVASGNPEPDFPEDLYRIIECGGALTFNEHGSWRCEYGHEHISYSDPARDAYEAQWAHAERMAD